MIFTRLFSSFIMQDIYSNKTRSLLSVIGIALGVAVMLAVALANKTAVLRFKENVNLISGQSNMHVVATAGDELDESILRKLQFLWDLDIPYTAVIEESAVLEGASTDLIQIIGVDIFADSAFRKLEQNESKDGLNKITSILEKNAALAGKDFASKHHLQNGSRIKVLVNDSLKELKIVGIIDSASFGKAYDGNLLLMDIGSAQDLFSKSGKITRIEIITPENSWRSVAENLKLDLPPGLSVERPADRSFQLEKMISAFQSNLTALSVIALLVGAFLLYNTMSITIIRKRPEIGILRALGADKLLIFNIFLAQTILIGLSGSALGVLFGCTLAQTALSAVQKTVEALYTGQPQAQIDYDFNTICSGFAIGLVMTICAALGPLIEAIQVNPAESMKPESYEPRTIKNANKLALAGAVLLLSGAFCTRFQSINGFPLFGYISAALIVFGLAFCLPVILKTFFKLVNPLVKLTAGIEASLSVSALSGSLSRTCVAVAGLMLGIAMMTSMVIMISSFRNTVTLWVEQTLKADLFIESRARSLNSRNARLSGEFLERIKHIEGVEAVDAFVHFPLKFNNTLTNLGSGDLDIIARKGNLIFIDNENSSDVLKRTALSNNSCIVTESFAERFHLKKGDAITIDSEQKKLLLKIEGIYFDYASDMGYIIIPRVLQKTYFPREGASSCAVYLKNNASAQAVRESILNNTGSLSQINILTHSGLKAEVLRVFDNTFAITYALHAISIAVAIIGVANTVLAIVLEMRKDFSILRYIGASMNEIKKIILIQSAILGFLGAVMGIIAGMALSLILIHVINQQSFGWTVQVSLPYLTLFQSFCIVILSSFFSGLIPAFTASRVVTTKGVRAE